MKTSTSSKHIQNNPTTNLHYTAIKVIKPPNPHNQIEIASNMLLHTKKSTIQFIPKHLKLESWHNQNAISMKDRQEI